MSEKAKFASTVQALVMDQNDEHFYAQHEGITYRIISDHLDTIKMGDVVEGFAYQNQKQEAVLYLDSAPIVQGAVVLAPAIKMDRKMGAFVDVSLPEKDLLVSVDLLPTLTHLWPTVGCSLFVKMSKDSEGQLWGVLADREYFETEMIRGSENDHNHDFTGYVVALHRKGTYVFDEESHLIFIHESERDEEPRLGEQVTGRIIGLREDGVLYGSLKPRAYEVIDDDAIMIYETLKRQPNFKMNLHPKSSVQAIDEQFGISKARFKRGISHLYKERLIEFDESGTWLKELSDYEES